MKKNDFVLCFAWAMILFVNTGCNKQSPVIDAGNTYVPTIPRLPPPPPPPNRPPSVNVGLDFSVVLFSNDMTLSGQATDPDINNTLSITWTKITGPACTIISPQSLSTKVSDLIEGEYLFELLVSDNYGATDRDTVAVKVNNIGSFANQANFLNLSWICPMGCSIIIYDIYSYIPSITPFRVIIKFVNQAGWFEALPISQYSTNNRINYYYEFDANNNIIVYTDYDMNTNIDVKILF